MGGSSAHLRAASSTAEALSVWGGPACDGNNGALKREQARWRTFEPKVSCNERGGTWCRGRVW